MPGTFPAPGFSVTSVASGVMRTVTFAVIASTAATVSAMVKVTIIDCLLSARIFRPGCQSRPVAFRDVAIIPVHNLQRKLDYMLDFARLELSRSNPRRL